MEVEKNEGERAPVQAGSDSNERLGVCRSCGIEAEREELKHALAYAVSGMSLAYEALESKRYDEAMLHLGRHHAQAGKVLSGRA